MRQSSTRPGRCLMTDWYRVSPGLAGSRPLAPNIPQTTNDAYRLVCPAAKAATPAPICCPMEGSGMVMLTVAGQVGCVGQLEGVTVTVAACLTLSGGGGGLGESPITVDGGKPAADIRA